jgi:hypothetical protein
VNVQRGFVVAAMAALSGVAHAAPVIFEATGVNAGAIQATVDTYRAALGSLNPNVSGSFGSGGRREINWDGVPNGFAAPNNLPANFFNANSPRGVVLSTPGTGFQVSANAGVAPVEFDNLSAGYSTHFQAFSAQRLFTALGSTVTDVSFFVPGSATNAFTSGFGVVFSDVDLANTTSLSFFDVNDNLLGQFFVDPFPGDETFSFMGVLFNAGEQVARVRIVSGSQALAPGSTLDNDLVAMDDFIYAEPIARVVPEPGVLVLLAAGALAWRRRAR